MTGAGSIRVALIEEHEFDDPDVVVWKRRQSYYVKGKESDNLPEINGCHPIDDPAFSDAY